MSKRTERVTFIFWMYKFDSLKFLLVIFLRVELDELESTFYDIL